LEALPLEVEFEPFGSEVANAGISALDVPDLALAEGSVTAEVEVHATGADSLTVQVMEEGRPVAEVRVAAPSPGLRSRVRLALPTPATSGRVRYTATVSAGADGFASDDEAVRYATVGHQEGALVLVSFRPDWEPAHTFCCSEPSWWWPAPSRPGWQRLRCESRMNRDDGTP